VQGSLLKKLRLNMVTETLIAFDERGCDRQFWRGINGDAIRMNSDFQVLGHTASDAPQAGDGQPSQIPLPA
jgi:hypothetical protein